MALKPQFVSPLNVSNWYDPFYPNLNTFSNSEREHANIGEIHIPSDLFSKFYLLSRVNTSRNIETLGYLYGTNSNNGTVSQVTHLFVPKQTGTATSRNAIDPTSCVQFQQQRNVVQLGWIHVHPEQWCFMSSIDCHVQYQAQKDNNNYIGIVYSNVDKIFGIFSNVDKIFGFFPIFGIFYVAVKQHPEFINRASGDGSKTYKPVVLLGHLSSLRHLDALKEEIDKKSLLAHCEALLRIWESRINNFSALQKVKSNKNINATNSNNKETKEVKRCRKIIENITRFLSSLNATNKHNFQSVMSDSDENSNNTSSINIKSEATANDTTMIKSDHGDANMNIVNNDGNASGMTNDLKQLEDKTINLFNIL